MFNLLSELARLPNLEAFPVENLTRYDDPGFLVYWKDLRGVIRGANPSFAESAGLSKLDEALGKTDFELYSPACAKIFKDNDAKILNTQRAALFIEPILAITEQTTPVIALTYKKPLCSSGGDVQGLAGVSFLISSSEVSIHESINSFLKERPDSRVDANAILSKREKEILYHITKGLSAKYSAKILNISPRTVEKHIQNIKIKMGVSCKSKLIEKAFHYFQI